ncbi:unnamed protein product [Heligmosomoides polygyrus]|uniref:Reverse transcriptase domain-containing protein n=1 Tax=Heligmosomoides polygyrus TaxID=6339 RepID=A0A3P7YHA2_HELPZ|nr:unnamed protein product [Heligmosomoides polygyrus]
MDAITRDLQQPVPWTLLYADDVMLACEDKDDLERHVQACCDRLSRFGLKLNVKKTEYLTTDVNESGSIKINGTELARTSVFKYLGSAIASYSGLVVDVNSRPYPPPPQYGQPTYNQQPGYAYPPGQVNYPPQQYPNQAYPQQNYPQQPGYQPYPQQYPQQQPVM